MRSEGVRGHLDLVLLGVLAAAPGHGYAVIKRAQAADRRRGRSRRGVGVPGTAPLGGPGPGRERVTPVRILPRPRPATNDHATANRRVALPTPSGTLDGHGTRCSGG